VSDDSSGRSRTMFSMPLAYSSTLDRRQLVARSTSYVEELWSPSLARMRGKVQAKAHAYCQRSFSRRAPRVFLSQAGPRFGLELFKLSITFGSDVD
jgi:hypothetical protein